MKAILILALLAAAAYGRQTVPEDEGTPQFYEIVNSDQLEARVGKFDKGPFLIFFGATWCGHCHHFKPVFEEIGLLAKTTHPELQLLHVNCSSPGSREACSKWDLPGYPTIYVASKGRLCMLKGPRNAEAVFSHLETCMDGNYVGMTEVPKTRGEYNLLDRTYYGMIGGLDWIADTMQKRPYVSIACVVAGIAVFLLGLTVLMNWLLDSDNAGFDGQNYQNPVSVQRQPAGNLKKKLD
jgi:thiol-disulfide isomerase/thioredoxin